MSQENVEIVRHGYELFAAGDLDGIGEAYRTTEAAAAAAGE